MNKQETFYAINEIESMGDVYRLADKVRASAGKHPSGIHETYLAAVDNFQEVVNEARRAPRVVHDVEHKAFDALYGTIAYDHKAFVVHPPGNRHRPYQKSAYDKAEALLSYLGGFNLFIGVMVMYQSEQFWVGLPFALTGTLVLLRGMTK